MSFEGYHQILCKQGHYEILDVYHMDMEDWRCSACAHSAKWWNMVDVTNGSYDDDGTRIDGFVYLEELAVFPCKCTTCGMIHCTSPTTYKVPEKGRGHTVK